MEGQGTLISPYSQLAPADLSVACHCTSPAALEKYVVKFAGQARARRQYAVSSLSSGDRTTSEKGASSESYLLLPFHSKCGRLRFETHRSNTRRTVYFLRATTCSNRTQSCQRAAVHQFLSSVASLLERPACCILL
jgi:hypothetical protein